MALDQILSSQSQKEVRLNEIAEALQMASAGGRHGSACAGLTFAGYGGTVSIAGVPTVTADWALTLTASTTCYVRRLDSTGVVSFTTSIPTDWPAPNGGYTPLFTVITGASTITSYTDWRLPGSGGSAAAVATGTGFPHITGGVQDGAARAVNLSGADVTGTIAAARMPAFTGDVTTSAGSVANTIASNAVTNAKAAQMAAHTFKGNNTGSTANAIDLSISQLAAELSSSIKNQESIIVAASDETTALTTGTAKITFRMPYAFTVSAVRASLSTAQATGSIFTVDINEGGTTILSTKLTIDNTEKTSTTAATAAVISDTSLADDAEMTVDIDQVGDGTAKGIKICIIGSRT